MINDPSDTDRNLCIFFSGDSECITVGKNVIRALKQPAYIGFRINKNWNSLIIFACNSKDQMSYKVPSKLFEEKRHKGLNVIPFHWDVSKLVPGKYLEDRNVVVFNLKDAFTHNKGVIEAINKKADNSDKQ